MSVGVLQPAPANILVIAVSRIGDTLFATPAIRALAATYPDASLTVLGHPKRAEVLENLPFVRRVGAVTKSSARWRGWLGRSFDLAVVFGYDRSLVRYAQRVAARVVAFEQGDAAIDRRLFAAVPKPPYQSEHAVLQTLRLPAALGIPPAGLRIAYRPTDDELRAADARIAGFAATRPLIGLQIASFPTKAYRDWPAGHFAALCRMIRERWPRAHFCIFGGTDELPRVNQLAGEIQRNVTTLAGRLSLRETAAVMSRLDLYIGVDTGPTHIMSAFDIPMIALYHCISPSTLTGPLEHPLCHAIDHPDTGGRCTEASSMGDIPVERVFGHVAAVLDGRAVLAA